MPLNLASSHLARLVELGLLRDAGTRKRAGRAIRLYRATSAEYFVPAEIADHSLGAELAGELRHLLERADRDIAGELFYIDGGRIRAKKVASERCGPDTALELWADLTLDTATAGSRSATTSANWSTAIGKSRSRVLPISSPIALSCVAATREAGTAAGNKNCGCGMEPFARCRVRSAVRQEKRTCFAS